MLTFFDDSRQSSHPIPFFGKFEFLGNIGWFATWGPAGEHRGIFEGVTPGHETDGMGSTYRVLEVHNQHPRGVRPGNNHSIIYDFS